MRRLSRIARPLRGGAPDPLSATSRPAPGRRWGGCPIVLATVLGIVCAPQIRAQMTSGPVSEGSGPLSELSTNTRDGSRPVHERARTLSDDRDTRLSGAPVRGSIGGPLRSGAVSDVTVGSVRGAGGTLREQTVGEGSAGSVKKDVDAPLHEFSAEPLHDFGLLQHELRHVRPLAQDPAADSQASSDPAADTADDLSGAAPLPEANEEADFDVAEPGDEP